ncbi:MAG: hypothetical protein ACTHM9_12660 [Gemmatimonadales bacterium]
MATLATESQRPDAPVAEAIIGERASAWPRVAVLFSSMAIVAGILWDISWHKTIGRDTFWTPPHLLEQLGAIAAGVSCGWLVLRTTFAGSSRSRAESVRFWGFRGPLGAWVTIWGTFVMITSAPFDDWWHNAYGLDVKIMSPPHMVLAVGMISVVVGGMLLMLAAQNRATRADEVGRLARAFISAGGLLVVMVATMISEYASRANTMHGVLFYQVAAIAFPVLLAALGRAGRMRFSATATALVYMGIILATIWILQLFPAQARLAPIYTPVTHMVPPEFPLLLVVPALAVDLLLMRARPGRDSLLAAWVGVVFVFLLLVVQWWFGEFLLSPAAHNYVFAAGQWPYMVRPGPWQHRFWGVPTGAAGGLDVGALARGIGAAMLIAIGSARVGLWWGDGMSRVVR